MRTLIRAKHVLAFEGNDHVLYPDGEVVYDGAEIIHVGKGWQGSADELIDAGNALVAPGLIDLDAIADLDHLLLDSWWPASHRPAAQWSEDYFRHRRHDVLPVEERIFVREYAMAQLLRHGVTTFMPITAEAHFGWAERREEMVGMAEAANRLGIRAYLGPSYRDGVNVIRPDGTRTVLWDESEGERGFKEAVSFLDDVARLPGDLVRGALLPYRMETVRPDRLRATAAAAERTDTVVRIHCLQDHFEMAALAEWYRQTPIELLRSTGLLNVGPLIPHGTYLGGVEFDQDRFVREVHELRDAGSSLVHCPWTSFRYGNFFSAVNRCGDLGLNVALGSDSYPPDLIRAAEVGNNLAKLAYGRLDVADIPAYFRAATLGGAAALGRNDLGRLAPGAQADFIVVGFDDPRFGIVDDPIRTLVINGSARDVKMTVVAGRVVMRDGNVTGAPSAGVAERAQLLFERMRRAYAERDYLGRTAAELFPPTFKAAGTGSASENEVRSAE